MKKIKIGFTLVELIIVIAIIATLSVIAVMTITEWIGKSRDTRRLADLGQIDKALDLAYTKNSEFPMPDSYVNVTANGTVIGYQGKFCDTAVAKTSIKTTPKDPMDDTCYSYYINADKNKFQIMGMLENDKKIAYESSRVIASNSLDQSKGVAILEEKIASSETNLRNNSQGLLNSTFAADYSKRYPKVRGEKLGILITSGTNQPIEDAGSAVDVVTTTNTYTAIVDDKTKLSGTGQGLTVLTMNLGKSVLASGSWLMTIGGSSASVTGDNNLGGINALFYNPSGLSVDYLGNIWIADSANIKVKKYDKYGNWLLTIGSISGDNTLNGTSAQFWSPRAVQVDKVGNVYIADYMYRKIKKYDTNGNYLMTLGGVDADTDASGTGAGFAANDYTIDSNGYIYVGDNKWKKVKKYDSNGNWLKTYYSSGCAGSTTFASVNGLAVDGGGNIYVADTSNYRIKKFDQDGNCSIIIGNGTVGDNNLNGTSAQLSPFKVVLDSNNNIYTINWGGAKVKKYDSNGNWIANLGGGSLTGILTGDNTLGGTSALFNDAGTSGPWGLYLDSQGNVYIGDSLNRKIKVYSYF